VPPGLTSPFHLLVIIVVALVVLGPENLPQALRQAGRAMAEFRRWSDSASVELRDVLSLDPEEGGSAVPAASAPAPAQDGDGARPLGGAAVVPATTAEPPAVPPQEANDRPGFVDPAQHAALSPGGEWSDSR
jgi:sec-independent protein translocase protein TatB